MYQKIPKDISESFPFHFQTDLNHTILSEKHNYLFPLGFRVISESFPKRGNFENSSALTRRNLALDGCKWNETEKLLEEINEELAA